MSNQCHVCYEWNPKIVDAIDSHDEEAYCSYCKKNTKRDYTCPHGAIVKPAAKKAKRKVARLITHDVDEAGVAPVLYQHQLDAIDKFKDANDICLFFEMGCGKTLTALKIAEYKYNKKEINALLVIAPNDLHKQWYDDLLNSQKLNMLNVSFDVQCIGGTLGQKSLEFFDDDGKMHIVIVNIDTFSTPHKWEPIVEWSNSQRCMLIVDEATVIKNPSAKRTQHILYEFNTVVKKRKAIISSTKINPVRCVLTGTPVTNGPADLWSIMEFVHPNYFNRNYWSFINHFGMYTKLNLQTPGGTRQINVLLTKNQWESIKHCQTYLEAADMFGCSEDTFMTIQSQSAFNGPYKHADELKQLLEPVSMFRKLTDCVDMPEKNYLVREVPMSEEQAACYKNMQTKMMAMYSDVCSTAANKLVVSLRLQQISSGFITGTKDNFIDNIDMFSDNVDADNNDLNPNQTLWLGDNIPKLKLLYNDIDSVDKPLIILTRYSAEAAKIYDYCKDKYSTCLITGWKQVGSIDEFKQGKYDIMVANSAKVSKGFNLQNAHTILFYSNSFSMETRQQAEFRIFRIGQKHPCLYIDYVTADIDKTVLDALRMKKNLLDYIREKPISKVIMEEPVW